MQIRYLFVVMMFARAAFSAEKYDGPRPPKPDLLYLVRADNLVPTETVDANEESKQDDAQYAVPGASSPARPPLPDPTFLITSEQYIPTVLRLYQM